MILWVDRPFARPASYYVGRSFWDFSSDEKSKAAVQSLFAWTLAMGHSTTSEATTGGEIPEQLFRFGFDRIASSNYVVVARFAPLIYARLTPAEEVVCDLLMRDHHGEEIAHALSISTNTVQSHRRNILHKVGVRGIAGLTRWWEERRRWQV